MIRRYLLPLISLCGLILGIIVVWIGMQQIPVPKIEFPPPTPPFKDFVAGNGIVEASSLNISIGAPFNEIVTEVYVTEGDRIRSGTPLFKLDDRALKAQLEEAQADRAKALANYSKLLNQPRPEEVPPYESAYDEALANYEDEKQRFMLYQNVSDERSISRDSFNQRFYAVEKARSAMERAKGDLTLIKSGAWIKDLEISVAEVKRTDALVKRVETDLERSIVRAPMDGEILQNQIRPGEKAMSGDEIDPVMLFGVVDPLQIRINVDEDDAWRIIPNAPAYAYVRGNSQIKFQLDFVRIEPYIVPKRSFTGETAERVDTRVLQVLYQFKKNEQPVYVGQIMDVYIEARPNL